jgi:hypothetical protein
MTWDLGHILKCTFQDVEILDLLSDPYNAKVLSRFIKLFPTDLIVGIVNGWKIMKARFIFFDFWFLLLAVTFGIVAVILSLRCIES